MGLSDIFVQQLILTHKVYTLRSNYANFFWATGKLQVVAIEVVASCFHQFSKMDNKLFLACSITIAVFSKMLFI